jgi:hypothetical protein
VLFVGGLDLVPMAAMRPGFEVVLLETRHVKAALSVMAVKTDRKIAAA